MSAPYWGKLPAPISTARQDRYSGDYSVATDQAPPEGHPRQRPHRVSVQTTNTDATESTFNPLDSPTASSFLGHGLAPRPPSYQHSTPDYPPDIADRRAHRRTRTNDSFEPPSSAHEPALLPPAVPDVPRGPPLSYRAGRWSNSSTPDPYAAAAAVAASVSRAARTSASPPVVAMNRAPESHPARAPPEDQRDYLPVDQQAAADTEPGASPLTRIAGEVPLQQVRKGSVREVNTGRPPPPETPTSNQPRRASATTTAERRRKFADDRSPLQKLELTLDSMTKEEKRAKVEAAERKARERAARNAESAKQTPPRAQKQQNQQEQARPGERSTLEGGLDENLSTPSRRPSGRGVEPAVAAHRGPLSQNPPEEPNRYQSLGQSRAAPPAPQPPVELIDPVSAPVPDPASTAAPTQVPPKPSGPGNMGLPKRNLSFRERAARQDIRPPNSLDSDSPTTPPSAPPQSSGGFSLSRSNSNKLRKDPPGDPWYRLRLEAENAMRNQPRPQQPQLQPSDPSNGYSTRGPPRMHPPLSRDDEAVLAPAPDVRRMGSEPHAKVPTTYMGPAAPQPHPSIIKNATEPIPSTTQTTVTFDDEPHILTDPATEVGSRESDRDYRPEYTPGDGLYLPPKYLDEWRQATVGSLGGALLDLKEEAGTQPASDTGKAWWESEPRQKNISSRPRKAEAFDGEYAETNGM